MYDVLLEGLRVNNGVIQEGRVEPVYVFGQSLINVCLEGCRGVGQLKWHYQAFKQSISCPEGCLPLVPLSHTDQVVGPPDVQLGEVLSLAELHQGFLD